MSPAPDTKTRHAAILAELAEIGMAMARGLKDEMETAETPETRAQAVAAFPKIARAVRQCVALEARLERDAARDAVEDAKRERGELERRIRRRKTQVTTWMQRAICNDNPDDDDLTAERMEDLRDRLHEDLLGAEFADRPLGEVIVGLCEALQLDPNRMMGGVEDDDPDDDPEDGSSGEPGGAGDDRGPEPSPAPGPPAASSPWTYSYSRAPPPG